MRWTASAGSRRAPYAAPGGRKKIRQCPGSTRTFGLAGSVDFDKTNQNTKMDTVHYMETQADLNWKAVK